MDRIGPFRRVLGAAWLVSVLMGSGCAVRVDPEFVHTMMLTGHFARVVTASADSFVVASYNVQYGEQPTQAIADLKSDPRTAIADILLLQEMDGIGTERIAHALGFDFVYYPATRHRIHARPFGNAILVRGTVLRHGYVELPVHTPFPLTPRIAVWADVQLHDRELRVVSAHTSTPMIARGERLEQFDVVASVTEDIARPILVGGDFNTPTQSDVSLLRRKMRESGLRHAFFRGDPTARSKRFWRHLDGITMQLDHVFYRELTLRSTGVVTGATASDHYPIWAVFEFDQ